MDFLSSGDPPSPRLPGHPYQDRCRLFHVELLRLIIHQPFTKDTPMNGFNTSRQIIRTNFYREKASTPRHVVITQSSKSVFDDELH
jgi:hypothetical protein